jgi:tocopherol cyclase
MAGYKIKKILDPALFQGEGKKRSYFEGWYFKVVDREEKNIYAIIPGVSMGKKGEDSHCFIQVLDGMNCSAHNFKYNIKDFTSSKEDFVIRIGDSYFSRTGIVLNIEQRGMKIEGGLDFKGLHMWPSKLREPGSMGWYSYVPFMECYHGIISLNHTISGSLSINESLVDFTGGRGYIEKDWGKSFPSSWLWFQSNHFEVEGVSLTCSIASIPWMGRRFTGFIVGLLIGKNLYRFTTYTGARLRGLGTSADKIYVLLEGKKYQLEILIDKSSTGRLLAPKMGVMEGSVLESITALVNVRLYEPCKGDKRLVFEAKGRNGGLEIMGDIESLKPKY